jgi:peptide/nickel transport system substrate-binding protein
LAGIQRRERGLGPSVLALQPSLLGRGGITPIVPGVALSAEPNEDATVWTLQLRPGVTLHDGSPFTIDDIVYNVANQSANPQPYF